MVTSLDMHVDAAAPVFQFAKEDEGEDIMDMDRIDADYVAIPELDRYDDADLDRREYGNMDYDDRRAAERELAERCKPRVQYAS